MMRLSVQCLAQFCIFFLQPTYFCSRLFSFAVQVAHYLAWAIHRVPSSVGVGFNLLHKCAAYISHTFIRKFFVCHLYVPFYAVVQGSNPTLNPDSATARIRLTLR